MKKILILLLPLISLFMSSCFKKEDPIKLPAGTSKITTVFLGSTYEKQLYFDLGTNSYQETQLVDWDICFESAINGRGIFINNGNDIKVRKAGLFNLNESLTVDTPTIKSLPVLIDAPDGKLMTSAIGDWTSYQSPDFQKIPGIYYIELSYIPGARRFKRMKVFACDDSAFYCQFTDLFDDAGKQISTGEIIPIPKSRTHNFTYFSFKNPASGEIGRIVGNVEPNKNSWDIEFTKYKHIFYDFGPDPFPYMVTGVLNNPNKVEVCIDSVNNFNEINMTKIPGYRFSRDRNVIGYAWKSFDRTSSLTYSVNSNITYIIRDTEGHYYKLRFLDFYNELRIKGYPKFEFIRIK